MIQVVCDSADLNCGLGARVPDVIIVGGFALDEKGIAALLPAIRTIKQEHAGDADAPVKWNMKDLERTLHREGRTPLFERLMQASDVLRSAMLAALVSSGATLFITILKAHSIQRLVLSRLRPRLVSYSFGNFLMPRRFSGQPS
jgi:hypothetical protein